MYPAMCEANQVKLAVSSQVSNEARMVFDAPGGAIAKFCKDFLTRLEGTISVVICDQNMALSESDDIKQSISIDVSEKTGMFL